MGEKVRAKTAAQEHEKLGRARVFAKYGVEFGGHG